MEHQGELVEDEGGPEPEDDTGHLRKGFHTDAGEGKQASRDQEQDARENLRRAIVRVVNAKARDATWWGEATPPPSGSARGSRT
ncbi:hypothetical protein LI90_2474 [Carbonactinospora thermoautotrophica]|uniref:Uncharacterized protein n=1 Tax=Carbonactinospora thermoautotrophica TaxID=1469144 RepID=A0A132MUC3_9ACTN|nr:hypothetical protein [Carbonactinospora thermoautotrophica]KWX01443.1 hypothetical protein LI90_2474 [Carbonactinospora thermoautotrophica]